jgi:ribonuclease P protein component
LSDVGAGGQGVVLVRGERHLTKRTQYALVYDEGRSWVDRVVVMKVMPNGLGLSRYGFSVGRRLGKAVVRNRVKRWLREALRHAPLKPGWDIIFIARQAAAEAGYRSLGRSVVGLLSRAGLLESEYEGPYPRTN